MEPTLVGAVNEAAMCLDDMAVPELQEQLEVVRQEQRELSLRQAQLRQQQEELQKQLAARSTAAVCSTPQPVSQAPPPRMHPVSQQASRPRGREPWKAYEKEMVERFGIWVVLPPLLSFLLMLASISLAIAIFAMNIGHLKGAARWSAMRPRECQVLEVAAVRKSYRKNDGYGYYVQINMRLPEGPGVPTLASLADAESEVLAQGNMRMLEAPGGGVALGSSSAAWKLRVVDTRAWRRFLPEMKARALRVELLSPERRLLAARGDGSLLELLEPVQGLHTQWLLALARGRCCMLKAMGVTASSRRFLGPARGGTAVELWTEEDASTWDLPGLPAEWLRYLRTPAPLGRLYERIPVDGACSERFSSCARTPSMTKVETELGLEKGSLFGGMSCYWHALPTVEGQAVPAWPAGHWAVQLLVDHLPHLDQYVLGLCCGLLAMPPLQWLIVGVIHCWRPTGSCALAALTLLMFMTFAAVAAFVVPLTIVNRTGLAEHEMEGVSIAWSSSPSWVDTWDDAAPGGHVGGEATKGAAAPLPARAVPVAAVLFALGSSFRLP